MPEPRRIRRITAPQDLRALAHPLRLRLLGALRLDGPATASALARRFGVSSGLTSYHLRALGERGFVEDDPGRDDGRERWWRACDDAHDWDVSPTAEDPVEHAGRVEAARALNLEAARVYGRWLEKVAAAEPDLDDDWRDAATCFDRWVRLRPERLKRLGEELDELLRRYEADADDAGDARRVGILFAAFPDDGWLP